MRVLITGGFGFIGAKLANALSDMGNTVTIIARRNTVQSRKLRDNIRIHYCDSYADASALDLLKHIDVCYHLANKDTPAQSNINIINNVSENLINTLKLLDVIRVYNVKIVYVSSGGTVYGNMQKAILCEEDVGHPTCSYGIVKKTVEDYLHLYALLYGTKFNVIRLANAYGIGQQLGAAQGAISAFIYKALTGSQIEIWGDGTVVRDYVYIDDVVSAIIAAGESQLTNRTYNIGCGKGHSLNTIIEIIRNNFRDSSYPEINVKYMQGRVLDVPVNILDITKAKTELLWSPKVELEDGISTTINWARMIV